MKTLIIYDNTGNIYMTMASTYQTPQGGVQFLEVEIPEGKYAKSVDVSVTPNIPILEDIPKSDIEVLQETVDALVLASLGV